MRVPLRQEILSKIAEIGDGEQDVPRGDQKKVVTKASNKKDKSEKKPVKEKKRTEKPKKRRTKSEVFRPKLVSELTINSHRAPLSRMTMTTVMAQKTRMPRRRRKRGGG